jgi:hypothetical protein
VVLPDQAALDAVLARARGAGVAVEPTGEGSFLRDPFQNGAMLAVRPAASP